MIKTEEGTKQNQIEGEAPKLKFAEKAAVTLGGSIGTFHHQVIQMFLLFFYTDYMKLNPGFVAVLFLACRIIDAVMTPAFGIFVDKTNTRWGKYKPWYIGAYLFSAVFGWLTFTTFNLSGVALYIYAAVTYLIYSILLSIGSGPSGALQSITTKRLDDRMSLGQIGYFLMMLSILTAQIAVQPLYKALGHGNEGKGFSIIMGAVAVIGVLIAVFQTFNIKERYVKPVVKGEKGPSLLVMCKAVFTNKTALIVYTLGFASNMMNGVRSGISIYYFKYYFHNDMLVMVSGMIALLPAVVGVAFSKKITKKIGLKNNLLINAFVGIVSSVLIMVCPPTQMGVILYMILLVVAGLFSGIAQPAQGTMMPAAMDYTEWKTGLNVNSFMGSLNGFMQSLSTAISGAVAAGSLAVIGYVAGASQQSASTLVGFRVMMSIVPAIILALTLCVYWFDLTEDKQIQIAKDLKARRLAEAAKAKE